MPLCSVCTHPQRHAIDAALLEHTAGYRVVAGRFGLAPTSVQRHADNHLRETIQQSKEARMLASSESLVAEMNRLHEYVSRVLARAEAAGDDRMILAGVGQGQRNVETLAKLGPLGELEQRVQKLEATTQPDDLPDLAGLAPHGEHDDRTR